MCKTFRTRREAMRQGSRGRPGQKDSENRSCKVAEQTKAGLVQNLAAMSAFQLDAKNRPMARNRVDDHREYSGNHCIASRPSRELRNQQCGWGWR